MSNKKLLASILSIVLAMAVLVQIPNLVLALSENDLTSTPADSKHSASFVKK
jgi:hypothetical protein